MTSMRASYGKRRATFEFDRWFIELASDHGIDLDPEDPLYAFNTTPYVTLAITDAPSFDDPLTISVSTDFFGTEAIWDLSLGELTVEELSLDMIGNGSEEQSRRARFAEALRDLAEKVEAISQQEAA